MQELINTHPALAAILGFFVAHFGHLTFAQLKEFGAFWESMRGWRGLRQFWLTGDPNPINCPCKTTSPIKDAPIFETGQTNQPPPQAEAAQPETK